MAKQSIPNAILNQALEQGVGRGDSITGILLGLYRLLSPPEEREEGRGKEAVGRGKRTVPMRAIVTVASERILVYDRYSGFSRNLSALLELVADRITRIPGLIGVGIERLRSCIVSILTNYVQRSVADTYEYCKELDGNLLIIPRGTLALACAAGKMNSSKKGVLYTPLETNGLPGAFNEFKHHTVYWQSAYQLIEAERVDHVVSQVEFASHMGFVASLGTTELSLILYEKYDEPRLHLLGHPLSLFPGVMPKIESLPIMRLKADTLLEEDYPALELGGWSRLPNYQVILDGSPFQPRLPAIRRVVKRTIGGMVSRLEDQC